MFAKFRPNFLSGPNHNNMMIDLPCFFFKCHDSRLGYYERDYQNQVIISKHFRVKCFIGKKYNDEVLLEVIN